MQITNTYAALDIGLVRIGVAITPKGVHIAQPKGIIVNNEKVFDSITSLIHDEEIGSLIVGLPRGLEGQETEQTKYVRDFIETLRSKISIPIHLQDEALTSVKAEEELDAKGKPYEKGDIDALAATIILQDYLQGLPLELNK